MTRTRLIALAALGSAGLLAGAFLFQALGYAPCKMCVWQRYPHAAAAGIGLLALLFPMGWLLLAGAAAAATTSAIGFFHAGVEQGWWDGPSTCSGGGIGNLSPDALLDQIMAAPLVRCDEVPWEFLTLSMASWNMLSSLVLMGLWIAAYRRS